MLKGCFMKKVLLLFLILSLLLVSCSNTPAVNSLNPDSIGNGVDYNDYIISEGVFAWTKTGVYTVSDQKIYHLNRYNEWNILCLDPSCEHDNPNCSAFLEPPTVIFSYDNYLYYINNSNNKYSLCRMSQTGRDRVVIKELDLPSLLSSQTVRFHMSSDILVISLRTYEADDSYTVIYMTTLDSDTTVDMIYSGDISLYKLTGNWLFFIETIDGTETLIAYNIETKFKQIVFSDFEKIMPYLASIYLKDDHTALWFLMNEGFYQMDLLTEEKQLLNPADNDTLAGAGCYDDKYVYIVNTNPYLDKDSGIEDDKKGLYVYDHSGNYVDYLSTKDIRGYISYAFATEEYVYFMNILDKPMLANYCIAKKDIGTEDMKWIIIN